MNQFASFVWGPPLLILLVGGGLFFTLYGRFLPYRYMKHAIKLLMAKPEIDSQGQLSHRQALAAALSGTVGMGNIAGVALAISAGGPGAIFWMWITALIGVSTKFFTCSLGIMYRGYDDEGNLQGGPMYIVREGLPKFMYPFALLFAIAGMCGVMPPFQINQLISVFETQIFPNSDLLQLKITDFFIGLSLAIFVGAVIWGGLKRIAKVALAAVPFSAISYFLMTLIVLIINIETIPTAFLQIFSQAFIPQAAVGGFLGTFIIGVSRGAFSNEAGIGTEVIAHSAAQTKEPIREGLVASLGPIIDTILICSCTGLVIITTGVYENDNNIEGVQLTLAAFTSSLGQFGAWMLAIQVMIFSLTTVFTFWYYGQKCFEFIFGVKFGAIYKFIYLGMVIAGAVFSVNIVFNFIIGMYALMAIPTMVATLILAPKVMDTAKVYFEAYRNQNNG